MSSVASILRSNHRTPLQTVAAPRGRGPYGITSTPDGSVFFASLAGNYLGRIVPGADGAFTLEVIEPPTSGQGTRRAWSDSRGAIWTSEWTAGQLGRYDPASGAWREWRLPGPGPQAYAVYLDERDDVWLSDFGANSLVRFDPDTRHSRPLRCPMPTGRCDKFTGTGRGLGCGIGGDALVMVHTACPGLPLS